MDAFWRESDAEFENTIRKISFYNLAITLSNEYEKNVPGLGTRQIVPDFCTVGYSLRPAFFWQAFVARLFQAGPPPAPLCRLAVKI